MKWYLHRALRFQSDKFISFAVHRLLSAIIIGIEINSIRLKAGRLCPNASAISMRLSCLRL